MAAMDIMVVTPRSRALRKECPDMFDGRERPCSVAGACSGRHCGV